MSPTLPTTRLLDDWLELEDFALNEVKRHPRTVKRWTKQPDGLPYAMLGRTPMASTFPPRASGCCRVCAGLTSASRRPGAPRTPGEILNPREKRKCKPCPSMSTRPAHARRTPEQVTQEQKEHAAKEKGPRYHEYAERPGKIQRRHGGGSTAGQSHRDTEVCR